MSLLRSISAQCQVCLVLYVYKWTYVDSSISLPFLSPVLWTTTLLCAVVTPHSYEWQAPYPWAIPQVPKFNLQEKKIPEGKKDAKIIWAWICKHLDQVFQAGKPKIGPYELEKPDDDVCNW